MLRYDSRWLLIRFDYCSWRDMVHAGYAVYTLTILACEWIAPGWAASVGIAPHVPWKHPEMWLHTLWRGAL